MTDHDEVKPTLSVIIAIVSDTTGPAEARHLAGCLAALTGQCQDGDVELIVPHLEDVAGLTEVKEQFPQARFLPITGLKAAASGGREHHDVLRAHGLLAARGELVALVEDHALPDEAFCAQVIAAHRADDAVIGGAMDNAVDYALNWAVYFCDFGRYQNPVPDGESYFASDANVSYRRSTLDSVRDVWESSFREVVVNGALRTNGVKVILRPQIIVYQNRSGLGLRAAMRERYVWGRSFAATRNMMLSMPKRLVLACLSPVLPALLTWRIAKTAWQRKRLFPKFIRSSALIVVLQVTWSVGEGLGYLLGIRD